MNAMEVSVAVMAGVFGLAIGSFLNVVIWRVPRGESVVNPPSACPRCDTPIRARHNVPVLGWLILRGRCFDCQAPISARYPLVELGTGLLFTAIALRFADQPLLIPAYAAFAALAVALSLIDVDVHRLPNALVLPAYPVLAVLLVLDRDPAALLRAGVAGLVLFTFFFALAVAVPGGMGMGDVKLAGLIAAMTAYLSWGAFLTGVLAAFVLGALVGVILIAVRRAGRGSVVPFGPFLLGGALASILGAAVLGQTYLAAL
jgi:leader peptidase (prepilin peptidase)/N-methyltransferase